MLKNLKRSPDFFDLQKEAEDNLSSFLCYMSLLNCKRCWRRRWHLKNKVNWTAKYNRPWHHHGGLLHLLSNAKNITEEDVNLWSNDLGHGFLHGFVTAFWAFLFEDRDNLIQDSVRGFFKGREKAENYLSREMYPEKLIIACLFHDYLKCKGIDKEHDIKLKNYFDYLDERTYTHSTPVDNSFSLIQGDRIELLRFGDCSWIDFSKLELKFGFTNHFYKHIRPIIERVIRFKEDIWLSHVVESKEGNRSFYPSAHWIPIEPGLEKYSNLESDRFSIHCGRLPFTECLDHTATRPRWPGIVGLINKKMLGDRKIISAPLSCWGRDHPFIETYQNPIPID